MRAKSEKDIQKKKKKFSISFEKNKEGEEGKKKPVKKAKKSRKGSMAQRKYSARKEWKNYDEVESTMIRNYVAFGRFILMNKLGKGGFGLIYSGIDMATGNGVAIKLEDASKARKKYLRLEYKTYCRLLSEWTYFPSHQKRAVPEVLHYGQEGGFRVLVIELLGVSLSSLFVYVGKRFNLISLCYITLKMINGVEYFHAKGLIHRDIKPANFVTGRGERSLDIYLIDFGLATSYIDKDGEHIADTNEGRFHGTDKYASINAHSTTDQSRRDDLEAVGYLAVYFGLGYLPWSKKYPRAQKPERRDLYAEEKRRVSVEELCAGLPRQFQDYFYYIKELEYDDKPDYDYLRYLFYKILEENSHYYDEHFDWTAHET